MLGRDEAHGFGQPSEKGRILIVEDDVDINQLLVTILVRNGYETGRAFSGSEALLCLTMKDYDLILLDLMLPGISGQELIGKIRGELGLDMPVIIVSARTALEDKVELLQSGADDYVTKPFESAEVLARVDANLRRYRKLVKTVSTEDAKTKLSFRELSLDKISRRVQIGEKEIALTAREFDILALLMSEPDRVFTRENLYQQVWGSQFYGEDNTVSVHLSNIRTKLAKCAPQTEYIKTVWGIGFKMAD